MGRWQAVVVRLLAAYYAIGGLACMAGAIFLFVTVRASLAAPVVLTLGAVMIALAVGLWRWEKWAWYPAVFFTALPAPALVVLALFRPERIGPGNVLGAAFASLSWWCLTRREVRNRFLAPGSEVR